MSQNHKNMQTTKEQISNFQWIVNIIHSCTNDFHFDSVDRLIELYHLRENNEQEYIELKLLRNQKWDEIHLILM